MAIFLYGFIMVKAVIFDFDGVICDSEPLHYEAFKQAVAIYDFYLSKEIYYRDYVGYCDTECIENIIKDHPDQLKNADLQKILTKKGDVFAELVRTNNCIFEGVRQFIELVHSNNLEIAICSGASGRDINLMLNGSGLNKYFKFIVSEDDVENGKPHPEGYILTLSKLNQTLQEEIQPGQCVVIEDSHWGIEAAQSAKMKTIAVSNTYNPDELKTADMVVDNLAKIKMADLHRLCCNHSPS